MKKRNTFRYIMAFLLVLSTTSCQKIIEFNGDETDPHLVLVSLPEAGSPWIARMTESRFFLINDTIATVKNASMAITVNGSPLNTTVTNHGNGMYDMGYTPQPGDSLTLHATVPGKGTIKAGGRFPKPVSIGDISCTFDTVHPLIANGTDTVVAVTGDISIKFRLDDPAEETNYYMVRIAMPSLDDTYDPSGYYVISDTIVAYRSFSIDDNILFDIDATNELFGFEEEDYYGEEVFFTDKRINGQSHTINLLLGTHRPAPLDLFCRVEVYSVSRDYYLYKKSIKSASNRIDFNSIISEPIQIYSNVTDGIGILGCATAVKFIVQ